LQQVAVSNPFECLYSVHVVHRLAKVVLLQGSTLLQ